MGVYKIEFVAREELSTHSHLLDLILKNIRLPCPLVLQEKLGIQKALSILTEFVLMPITGILSVVKQWQIYWYHWNILLGVWIHQVSTNLLLLSLEYIVGILEYIA